MAECEKLSKCVFFNDKMASIPATAELMKTRYCKGDKTQCARYQVAKAGKTVPPDLYPNQKDKAKEILMQQ